MRMRLGEHQGQSVWSGEKKNDLPLPGIDTWFLSHPVCHYSDYAWRKSYTKFCKNSSQHSVTKIQEHLEGEAVAV